MNSQTYYYRIDQIRTSLDYNDQKILLRIYRETGLKKDDITSFKVIKRSVDARNAPQYILSVEIETKNRIKRKSRNTHIIESRETPLKVNFTGKQKLQPVVVGAGPAGLWAAWYLAKAGTNPILLERGEEASKRKDTVNKYWNEGILNKESNVLFGEGGAGLFSDGKLTARSKDKGRVRMFLDLLVKHGASEDILIETHPHIGSDELMKIVPSIREEIKTLGGEIHFSTTVQDIIVESNQITALKTNKAEIKTDKLILATGHSARDIYKLLSKKSVALKSKPFAIGLRLEIPQDHIDKNRYRCYDPRLGAASFRLTRKENNDFRACYTFCMCPGGQVISCAHEEGMITSNGMSYSRRSMPSGNAAFLVPVLPADHEQLSSNKALTGIIFQEELEKRAFIAGGGNYALPASDLTSFVNNTVPAKLANYCSPHHVKAANLNSLLPDFISKTLRNAIPPMLSQLGNPDPLSVMLYGTETRSSSPVQVTRDENGESVSTKGLFPAGEGAGYAGGIVSSGVDGLKAAESLVASYK